MLMAGMVENGERTQIVPFCQTEGGHSWSSTARSRRKRKKEKVCMDYKNVGEKILILSL